MSREVRRVPLDFDWPLDKVWGGYLSPDKFDEVSCPDCTTGRSPGGQYLYDLWYGNQPFIPESTGSTRLRHDTPAVRAFAERNIAHAPEFYGSDEFAVVREGRRLADLWNGSWCHHLAQEDVDLLVAEGRLRDFTHAWNPETRCLEKIEPPVTPTAAQVNEWSLRSHGHDAINAYRVIEARCEREGVESRCARCEGHGSLEAYPGQRAEAEAWECTEPPEGEGWQIWETVSEGSPISPVFETAEQAAQWLTLPERDWKRLTIDVARRFVEAGWAPSFVSSSETGLVTGEEWVGRSADSDETTDNASNSTVEAK